MARCERRIRKHSQAFLNELSSARCTGSHVPAFTVMDVSESPDDMEVLGPYCADNHNRYMDLSQSRYRRLKTLCTSLARSRDMASTSAVSLSLTETAHHLRRSNSFQYFIKSNIQATRKPAAIECFRRHLEDRIGKLARFFRASLTIFTVAEQFAKCGKRTLIRVLPFQRYEVSELRNESARKLLSRAPGRFSACNEAYLQTLLQRWQNYRLHAEIQLVVFYEQHPSLTLASRYIGCDKLCCYLCFKFLSAHGQFVPNGSHQSLYSLWTFPVALRVENAARASALRSAICSLCHDLEWKVSIHGQTRVSYPSNNESFANLSRISLPFRNFPTHNATAGLLSSIDEDQVGLNNGAVDQLQKEIQEQDETESAERLTTSPLAVETTESNSESIHIQVTTCLGNAETLSMAATEPAIIDDIQHLGERRSVPGSNACFKTTERDHRRRRRKRKRHHSCRSHPPPSCRSRDARLSSRSKRRSTRRTRSPDGPWQRIRRFVFRLWKALSD